jgi:hypothetical protein
VQKQVEEFEGMMEELEGVKSELVRKAILAKFGAIGVPLTSEEKELIANESNS